MNALYPAIIAILQKYMRDPLTAISGQTALSALDIDDLDLPMIFLDIEDAFDVQVPHADEADRALTVADLIAAVAACLEAKRIARAQPIARRPKRSWVSTGAER